MPVMSYLHARRLHVANTHVSHTPGVNVLTTVHHVCPQHHTGVQK